MLLAAAAAMTCAAGIVLGFGFAVPVEVSEPAPGGALSRDVVAADPASEAGDAPTTEEKPSLAALRRVASLDLRQPLFEPSPPTTPQRDPRPTGAKLSLDLLGTVDEPGHSYAILALGSGEIELRGEGEVVDTPGGTVTVLEVEPRRVVVRHGGQRIELEMPEPEVRWP